MLVTTAVLRDGIPGCHYHRCKACSIISSAMHLNWPQIGRKRTNQKLDPNKCFQGLEIPAPHALVGKGYMGVLSGAAESVFGNALRGISEHWNGIICQRDVEKALKAVLKSILRPWTRIKRYAPSQKMLNNPIRPISNCGLPVYELSRAMSNVILSHPVKPSTTL